MSLNKTSIDYLDSTWNPYTGCNNWQTGICGGGGKDFRCWAKSYAQRFQKHYPRGFEPTFWPNRLFDPMTRRKPARIGVSFMGDLFLDSLWIPTGAYVQTPDGREVLASSMRQAIMTTVKQCPQHTFLFLTKCPWNLVEWNPWPDNCWVGASATNAQSCLDALVFLQFVEAKVRYLSLEPLLGDAKLRQVFRVMSKRPLDWIIIGAATNPYRTPCPKWIKEIERAADTEGIPVFEKSNLKGWKCRREYPGGM